IVQTNNTANINYFLAVDFTQKEGPTSLSHSASRAQSVKELVQYFKNGTSSNLWLIFEQEKLNTTASYESHVRPSQSKPRLLLRCKPPIKDEPADIKSKPELEAD
ncbi:MAG: hypothetical protein M4579_007533, partial [Chaenotheca gracillima]